MTKAFFLLPVLSLFLAFVAFSQQPQPIYLDTHYSVDNRVNDLISRMTIEEKVLQMQNDAPAIPRLGIPAYNWWNECLHGVARNGVATVFPQAIGMAATWNPALINKEADIISTEARAKYNYIIKTRGKTGLYEGLTFWSPNINIFRDPRWGRGQETYGEDPYLTGRIGVAFVKGLQGNIPGYLKVIATAKHFAVHSGPEPLRHKFDAWCSEQDLYETYLPAFEALVREAKVSSIMGAYNRVYNEPCCASDFLLDETLRKKWGFTGYVVSDCGAIYDIFNGHRLVSNAEKASVLGVKAGCDLTCGDEYGSLLSAVEDGLVSEEVINKSLNRLFTGRFRLGLFDPYTDVPFNRIGYAENDKDESRQFARKVAQESIVLLKNENQTLPISRKIKSIAVIGPYANNLSVLQGNYNGMPSNPITFLAGITEAAKKISVTFAEGVLPPEEITNNDSDSTKNARKRLETEAIEMATTASVIVFVGGISPNLEGEEMKVEFPGFSGGDRTSLDIPENQIDLLKKLQNTGKPIILVLTGGSALSINWAKQNIPAIVDVWYPGEEGGNALADVLFGDYNPAGRLPVTFYKSVNDLPSFENYAMKSRTYRYFTGEPLYPFGYGLSYTTFGYDKFYLQNERANPSDTLMAFIDLKNTGTCDGDEVVQIYVKKPANGNPQPIKSLVAFKRVNLKMGEARTISIPLVVNELRQWDYSKEDYSVLSGMYTLFVASSSSDIHLQTTLEVTTNPIHLSHE
jgi:beta-glucosidase